MENWKEQAKALFFIEKLKIGEISEINAFQEKAYQDISILFLDSRRS